MRQQERERASERAGDSWELLSDGNWTPTCCSLGSLLMNSREREGSGGGMGKEDRRKPSCVMYGHGAKASISFTKPLSMSNLRLNNLLLLSPGEKGQEATLIPPPSSSLSSFVFLTIFIH